MRNLFYLLFTVFIFVGCSKDELESELQETQQELNDANVKIAALQQTINELVAQGNDDSTSIAEYQAQIAALQSDIALLEATIAELEVNEEENLATIARLEEELADALARLEAAEFEIIDLNNEINELNADLVAANIDVTNYLEQISALEAVIEEAGSEIVYVTNTVTETVEIIKEVIVTETNTVTVEVPVIQVVTEVVTVTVTEIVTETVTEIVTETIEVEITKVVTETVEVEVEVQCDFTFESTATESSTTTYGEWSAWSPDSAASDVATITQTRKRDKHVKTTTTTTTVYTALDDDCEDRDNDVETDTETVTTTETQSQDIANPSYVEPGCDGYTETVTYSDWVSEAYDCNDETYTQTRNKTTKYTAKNDACDDKDDLVVEETQTITNTAYDPDVAYLDPSNVLDALTIDKSLDNDAVIGTYEQTARENCTDVTRNVKVWQYWSDSAEFTESDGEVDYNKDGDQLDVYIMRSWYFSYQADGGQIQSVIDHQEYVLVTDNSPTCDETEFESVSVQSYDYDTTKTSDHTIKTFDQSRTVSDCSKETRTVKIIQEYELSSSNNSESDNNTDVNGDGDKLDTYKVEKWWIKAYVGDDVLDNATKQMSKKTVTTNKCETTDHLTKDEIWKAAPLLDVDLDYGGNKNKVTYTFTSTATLEDCTIEKKSGFVQQTWIDVNETFNESDLNQDVNNDGDMYDVVTPRKHRLVIYLGGTAYGYGAWETAYYVSTDKSCTYTANTPVTEVGEWSDWVITDTDVTSDDYYVNAKRTKTTTKTTSYTKSFDDCADKADLVEVSTETETKSNHINPDFVVKTLGVISVNGTSGTFKNNVTQKDWLYPTTVDSDDVIQIAVKGLKQDGNNDTPNWDTNVSDLTVGSYVDIGSKDGFTYSLMLTDGDYIYLQITVEDHTKTFTNFNAGFYPKN